MTTYRELVYMCLDLIKGYSDDFSYTEEHVMFLLDKYRALLLKQRYGNDPKKYIPISNYSNLELNIANSTLISDETIPPIMNIGVTPRITTEEYYNYKIEYVPRERFPYVGESKYLKGKIGYCTTGYDNRLITKNFPFKEDQETNEKEDCAVIFTAILETPIKEVGIDSEFPLEESLIPNLIQLVLKDLLGAAYRPSDNINNASDDLAALAGYLSKALKQPYTNNLRPEDTEDK